MSRETDFGYKPQVGLKLTSDFGIPYLHQPNPSAADPKIVHFTD